MIMLVPASKHKTSTTAAAIPISFLSGFLNEYTPIPDSVSFLHDKQDPPVMFFLTNESPHYYFPSSVKVISTVVFPVIFASTGMDW